MSRSFRLPLIAVMTAGGLVVGRYAVPPAVHGQPAAPHEMTSYRDVVKQVLPAVVSIEAKSKPKKSDSATARRNQPQFNNDIPDELRRFFPQFPDMDNMPQQQRQAFGSGFIVDANGTVMTNNHVVAGADEVEVTLTDGRKFSSSDIKTDKDTDLAVIHLKANKSLPYLRFGDSSQMEIGDRVLAVGAPFGLAGSVTQGIISAKGRDLGLNRYDDFLQTDAAINPGNSGGPLINLAGEVVGINSAIKSRSGGFQGVGMAITSNTARNVMSQLEKNGIVKRPYLGIEMARDVSPDVAAQLGIKEGKGVVVARVVPNSPAAKAGVQSDDVILSLDGKAIPDNRSLLRTVGGLDIGKKTKVEVLREGKSTELTLKLEEQPKGYGDPKPATARSRGDGEGVTMEKFGLELGDLPADRAQAYDVKGGALVTSVEPNSPAAEAGIGRGMVITKVDKKDVTTAESARQALEKSDQSKGVMLHLRSPEGGTAIVLLKKS
jgi:serine protease Do